MNEALDAAGGRWTAALDALREQGLVRLRPTTPGPMNAVSGFVAKHHIGDPVASSDAWRPWRRRSALRRGLAYAGLDTARVSLVPQR